MNPESDSTQKIEMWSEGFNVITVTPSSTCRLLSEFLSNPETLCQCCGSDGTKQDLWDPMYKCNKCNLPTCKYCSCNKICIFCIKRQNLTLSPLLQEHLESLYAPGGYQFNQAKNKIKKLE